MLICRNISSEKYGPFFTFSVKLTLAMQITGFSVRLSSSLLWIQIYRLGISYMETPIPREADYDLRNSFLSPATPVAVREPSVSDDIIGGSIYDPTYYSSLFEDGQDSKCLSGVTYQFILSTLSCNRHWSIVIHLLVLNFLLRFYCFIHLVFHGILFICS